MKLEQSKTPHTQTSSKWIKDLNARPYTIKQGTLRENTLWHQSQKDLYEPPPRVMKIKTKTNKLDLSKLKGFCRVK